MKKIIVLIIGLVFFVSCQKSFLTSYSTGPLSAEPDQLSSVSTGAGELTFSLVKPQIQTNVKGVIRLKIQLSPIDKLKSLILTINNSESYPFQNLPLEMDVNTDNYDTSKIRLDFKSLDLNSKENYLTVFLYKNNSDQVPLPANSDLGGVIDPQCSVSSTYDACLFFKNPVFQNNFPFTTVLNFGTNLDSIQTFGVVLDGRINPSKLESTSLRIGITHGEVAEPSQDPNQGPWKYSYKNDTKGYIAQLMAYHWLNYQEKKMIELTGVFFAKNKSIYVDALNKNIINNAFWDGSKIAMGMANSSGSRQHEMALSSEIYLHEMGHANIDYATNKAIHGDPNGPACNRIEGCISAINEGQADFHFVLIFPEHTAMGETWANRLAGISLRDVSKNMNLTMKQAYDQHIGEEHDMGAVYASILYSIYINPNVVKSDFEKLFSLHLQKLTSQSRFKQARDILIADNETFFNGKYTEIIRTAFNSRGVEP